MSEYAGASGALSSEEDEEELEIGFEAGPSVRPLGGLRVPLRFSCFKRASSLALESAKALKVPPSCRHSCVMRFKSQSTLSELSPANVPLLTSVVGVITMPGSEKSVGTRNELGSMRKLPTVPLRLETLLLALLTSSM